MMNEEDPAATLGFESRAATEQTDEQLMVAFARGRQEAFDAIFRRYRQPLFGFFRRRLPDTPTAEELTQETFLAVLRASQRYEACAPFRTYLFAIAFRILRAHRRKDTFRALFWGGSAETREPAVSSGVEAEIVFRDALTKLDRFEQEILMLREYEQLSYAEIAELMALPINTVRTRLFRARAALREVLSARGMGATEFLLTREEHA